MKHKNLFIFAAILSVFSFFVSASLWAGRANEKKYKIETEVRRILALSL